MNDVLAVVITCTALLLAAWSFLLVARSRGPQISLLWGLAALELLLVAQVAVSIALASGSGRPEQALNFFAYLATAVLIVPAGALWALTDRSRWGPAVLGVACLVVPVLLLRMGQLWDGTGA